MTKSSTLQFVLPLTIISAVATCFRDWWCFGVQQYGGDMNITVRTHRKWNFIQDGGRRNFVAILYFPLPVWSYSIFQVVPLDWCMDLENGSRWNFVSTGGIEVEIGLHWGYFSLPPLANNVCKKTYKTMMLPCQGKKLFVNRVCAHL